jgi:lysine 2,3-aminomutase
MNKLDFIFSYHQLIEYLKEKSIDTHAIPVPSQQSLAHPFYLLIPKYYIDLIDWNNPQDPLMNMVLTSNLEADTKPYQLADPIGDQEKSPVPGIIHRYPDRCLLMLSNVCAVHCRFCFRRNLLDKNHADYKKSISYIRNHKEIWEVILSGGDPFMLTDHFLKLVMDQLRSIPHVKLIRFHTRTPAVYPARLTPDFIDILAQASPTIVVLHINHPREITPDFTDVVKRMRKAGIMLLSQTVLMKQVNNDPRILGTLFKHLVEIGVKPYYLHHLDLAAGTHHFRVSIEEGKSIMQNLRGHISGHCIPEYVIDVPGGLGKIPVSWFSHSHSKVYEATSFQKKHILYTDHFTS